MNLVEAEFNGRVEAAMKQVKLVLDNTKHPAIAGDVPHVYDDKYLLAEFLTNTMIAALLNTLETLGLDPKGAAQLIEWSKQRSVSLRFAAEEKCTFIKEVSREEEDPDTYVHERKGGFLGGVKVTQKVVRTVTDYFWKYEYNYSISAFVGSDPAKKVTLVERQGQHEMITSSKVSPRKENVVRPPKDTNISWLFARLHQNNAQFKIDRQKKSCHTPRRNEDSIGALEFTAGLLGWCAEVSAYFLNIHAPVDKDAKPDFNCLNVQDLFVPVIPLFEDMEEKGKEIGLEEKKEGSLVGGSGVVPLSYINPFLKEQLRSLNEKIDVMSKTFTDAKDKVFSSLEGRLVITCRHMREIAMAYERGMDYIEDMIRSQLIAAIGKVLNADHFNEYMIFHNRKLYKEEFAPSGFCFSIRRPDHMPEGTLSIEKSKGDMPESIQTISRHEKAARPMKFPINAGTNISFTGDRYVHAWLMHSFSGSSIGDLKLVGRARQFSSFILMIGRIGGPNLFEPKHAIIVQNKDELMIPLLLEQIPAPKEFQDAIESLSPEQQRFAKAFRSMQLEGTLFAVCVVQIKPQLEKVLNLPDDSLTKEIKLTQQLLQLFIDYQIPSDLLSYDGDENNSVEGKINRVKELVKEMFDMISTCESEQLAETLQKREMSRARHDEHHLNIQLEGRMASVSSSPSSSSSSSSFKGKRKKMKKKSVMKEMDMAIGGAPGGLAGGEGGGGAPGGAPELPSEAPSVEPSSGEKKEDKGKGGEGEGIVAEEEGFDVTKIPQLLESRFLALDEDAAVRPTTINFGEHWTKKFKKTLIQPIQTCGVGPDTQKTEKNKAFDLLDALTKSGSLMVDQAELHVVIAGTHCFDQDLMDTVVKGNVNPIEKVERSSLIFATTIHEIAAKDLVNESQLERVATYAPKELFP